MSAQVLFCMTALQPTHAIRRGQGLQTEPPGNRFEVPPVDRHDHLRVSVHTVPSNEVRHAARHAGRLEVFRARQNRLAFERHRCEQPVLPRQRRRQQNSRRIEITAKGPRARREPSVRADRLYIAGTIRRAWWHIVSVGLRKPIERGAEADRVTVGLFMSLCKGCIWVNWSWDRAALGELVLGPVECRGLRIGRHDAYTTCSNRCHTSVCSRSAVSLRRSTVALSAPRLDRQHRRSAGVHMRRQTRSQRAPSN